jgi:hypothetical protein
MESRTVPSESRTRRSSERGYEGGEELVGQGYAHIGGIDPFPDAVEGIPRDMSHVQYSVRIESGFAVSRVLWNRYETR